MTTPNAAPSLPVAILPGLFWGIVGSIIGCCGTAIGLLAWSLITGHFAGAMWPILAFCLATVGLAFMLGTQMLLAAKLGLHLRPSRWIAMIHCQIWMAIGLLLTLYAFVVQPALVAQGADLDRFGLSPLLPAVALVLGAIGSVVQFVMTLRQR